MFFKAVLLQTLPSGCFFRERASVTPRTRVVFGRGLSMETEDDTSGSPPELVPVRVWMTLLDAQNLLIAATPRWAGGSISKSATVLGIEGSTRRPLFRQVA
jgi:hypothetical protein